MRTCPPFVPRLGLGALIVGLVVDVAALAVDVVRGNRIRAGATFDDVGLDFSSTLSSAANGLLVLGVLAAAAGFGWWFWCCYRNLAAAGLADLAPIWALAGWVVPVLNVIRPPQIMHELARKPSSRSADVMPVLVVGWWLLWIEGAVIQVALRFIRPTTDLGWSNWQWAALLSDLILLASVGCALALVSIVVERQTALRRAAPMLSSSRAPGLGATG